MLTVLTCTVNLSQGLPRQMPRVTKFPSTKLIDLQKIRTHFAKKLMLYNGLSSPNL